MNIACNTTVLSNFATLGRLALFGFALHEGSSPFAAKRS